MIQDLSFNLFDQTLGESDAGPPIVSGLNCGRTWIIGLGAIGNGVLLLIDQLKLRGNVVLVDRQTYGPENLGTCVLIGAKRCLACEGPRDGSRSRAEQRVIKCAMGR